MPTRTGKNYIRKRKSIDRKNNLKKYPKTKKVVAKHKYVRRH
jgi:hypothetical protein